MRIAFGRTLVLGLVVVAVSASAYGQWVYSPEIGRFVNLKRQPKETPELQLEHARTLMLEGDYKNALQEAEKFERFYGDSELADENQFLRGQIEEARGNYLDAAREYQQVVASYPESDLFDQVLERQYEIGNRFYEKGQAKMQERWTLWRERPFKRAIQVYEMVVDNQPFTEAAAAAQYKIGLCYFTREDYLEASYEYQRVVEEYPASEWVDDAAYGLALCYYEASLPPAYDQSTSQLAVNAVDDFNARFPNDERASEMNTVKSEMREKIAAQRLRTARFYERRRDFEAATIYYRLLVSDFSGTEAAETATQWLAEHNGGELDLPLENEARS